MANEHYSQFIEEAFIKPIRSVLIVDDDYPTLDEILDFEIAGAAKAEVEKNQQERPRKRWHDNPQRIKNVIAGFRRPEQPLLVDIHDGANVDTKGDKKVAAHLHQSDLLVLDYELDKDKPNDGWRAIEILRGLLSNDHFNLVVVHTSENLDDVFANILFGILAPTSDDLSADEAEQAANLIADREEVDEDVLAKLTAAVADEQYLNARQYPATYLRTMGRNQQPYSAYRAITNAAGWDNSQQKLVLRSLLSKFEKTKLGQMSERDFGVLEWSTGGRKWIKADSVFVAFSSKTEEDVIGELQSALENWNPEPSRLFLAKLRAEMDEHGVVAQTKALERKHALAHWYARLLKANGDERRWLISESVARHSDQLLNSILARVESYATRLVDAEAEAHKDDVEARVKEHFKVDLSVAAMMKRAENEHNAFVCSKPPSGWHLTTGHVFEMEGEYWVCLSPACDLVPGQGQARVAEFGNRVPFVAVKLFPVAAAQNLQVNSNLYIFLTLDEEVQGFCFNENQNEQAVPLWRLFYAQKRGEFGPDFSFRVATTQAGKRRLISIVQPARVVAQLRYEYAINLVQKLGGSLTRIGLDFV